MNFESPTQVEQIHEGVWGISPRWQTICLYLLQPEFEVWLFPFFLFCGSVLLCHVLLFTPPFVLFTPFSLLTCVSFVNRSRLSELGFSSCSLSDHLFCFVSRLSPVQHCVRCFFSRSLQLSESYLFLMSSFYVSAYYQSFPGFFSWWNQFKLRLWPASSAVSASLSPAVVGNNWLC